MELESKTAANWAADISDHIALVTMDWLTVMGRRFLPEGYWGDKATEAINRPSDEACESTPCPSLKTLYITFDDGPNPHTTERLLKLLEEENVPASFFFIGSQVEHHPELMQSPRLKQHVVGSHSYSHRYLPLLKTKDIEAEIIATNKVIEETIGYRPWLFRPPYGMLDRRAADCLEEHEMKIVYWGAVPQDWRNLGHNRVSQRVVRRLAHGQMIVLHEGKRIAEQTILSTREIIRRAKALGYEFKALAG
jgi:peptidoglycan-N-acetylglucosamine deacetylase